jgi:hypothetical protein
MNDIIPQPGAAYADQSAAVIDSAANIGAYLAIWAMRDDSKPDAPARRAANEAMDAIDRALAELHRLRERLVGDIRRSDDAAIARAGAMLDGRRAARSRLSATNPMDLAAVTADESGEHPGDAGQAAGPLPWTMSGDGTEWRAELPDGRTAVIRRVLGDDGESSILFVPAVHESATDYVTGPECGGVLAAAAWVWHVAGLG